MVETRQGDLHYIVNNHVTNSKLYATLLMWQYNLGVHEMVLKTLKLKNNMNKLKSSWMSWWAPIQWTNLLTLIVGLFNRPNIWIGFVKTFEHITWLIKLNQIKYYIMYFYCFIQVLYNSRWPIGLYMARYSIEPTKPKSIRTQLGEHACTSHTGLNLLDTIKFQTWPGLDEFSALPLLFS